MEHKSDPAAVQEQAPEDESWDLSDESMERLNGSDLHFFCAYSSSK
jgi:hypothetical protein